MRKFYTIYKEREAEIIQSGIGQLGIMQENGIVQSPIGQLTINHKSFPFKLSWTHYQVLMTIEDSSERSFYELEAVKGAWNVRTLKRQYNSSLYERLALSREKHEVMEMAAQGSVPYRPEDILKSPFVLEFAGLDDKSSYHENDLEEGVLNKLQDFLFNRFQGGRINSSGFGPDANVCELL